MKLNHENIWAQIRQEMMQKTNKQKLLGLEIDRNQNLTSMYLHYAGKLGIKFKVLARLSGFMSMKERKSRKVLYCLRFAYWYLIWMFYCRVVSSEINHSHERSICMVYEDKLFGDSR